MKTYNHISLIGRLGQDPDYRQSKNGGSSKLSFSMATTESTKVNNKWENKPIWHNIVCFGGIADYNADVLSTGSLVHVEGTLTNRPYTDKKGVDRVFWEVRANRVRSLDATDDSNNDDPGQHGDCPF